MTVTEKDLVYVDLPTSVLSQCIQTSIKITDHIVDRKNLHERDNLERFINILMGEVAEQMVIYWLLSNGKFAESSVDKSANAPDVGHDIWVKSRDKRTLKASVKSSLSVHKQPRDILSTFKMATTPSELKDINIQVYFWLSINSSPRVNVPSLRQSALVAWGARNDLNEQFSPYQGEQRLAPKTVLGNLRPMADLLSYLE